MKKLLKNLLSTQVSDAYLDSALLFFRAGAGLGMIHTHGMKKVIDFQAEVASIPDPLGIGGYPSAVVAVLINIVCAGLVVMGFFTRLNALLILGLTLMGLLVVHAADPWPVRDVPYMYSLAFGLILLLGAGRYSLDQQLYRRLN